MLTPLPLLTHDLPGCGGRIRVEPEDFDVTEIAAYEPSGSGEHLYLWIEKRGVGAEYFQKLVSRKLGVSDRDIGIAGLKDRHAVTRQWVSVPQIAEPRLKELDGDGISVLNVTRHGNKLRSGHLHGNTFSILIRDAQEINVEPILEVIRRAGLPNYYGPQRFGRDGETARRGFELLTRKSQGRVQRFQLKLFLSAAQSHLFNDVLARRQNDGLLRSVLEGDVMMKWPAGGMFVAEDVPTEQTRFDARETVTGGPMFGTRTFAAKAIAAEREAAVLAEAGLTEKSFEGFGQLLSGTRRHNLIYIDDLSAERTPDGLRLAFSLPAGSYATILLREVMKCEVD